MKKKKDFIDIKKQKVVNRTICAHRANRPCHPDAVSVKIVGCSIASLTSTTFLMRSITPSYQEARNHNPKTRTGHVPNPKYTRYDSDKTHYRRKKWKIIQYKVPPFL